MDWKLSVRALAHWRDRWQHRSLLNEPEWKDVFAQALRGRDLEFALTALWGIAELEITTGDDGTCRVSVEPAENHLGWVGEGPDLLSALLNAADRLRKPDVDPRRAFLTSSRRTRGW